MASCKSTTDTKIPRFKRRMLERFLSQPQSMSREDVDYLLDKIDKLSTHAAAEADLDHANAA